VTLSRRAANVNDNLMVFRPDIDSATSSGTPLAKKRGNRPTPAPRRVASS
jgi:hypothetical protein